MKTNRANLLTSLLTGVATILVYGAASGADTVYISNGGYDTVSVINL